MHVGRGGPFAAPGIAPFAAEEPGLSLEYWFAYRYYSVVCSQQRKKAMAFSNYCFLQISWEKPWFGPSVYSTVTDFAKFLGLSMSQPFMLAT